MIGVGIVLGGLLLVMVLSELALGKTKLQTGLSRVLVVWTLVYLPLVYVAFRFGSVGPLGLTIFWGGAFLSWFGVRSHIESSILLRMLHMLRKGAMDESSVVEAYTATSGESVRLEELVRGGMAQREGESLSVTKKGQTILGVVAKLRG